MFQRELRKIVSVIAAGNHAWSPLRNCRCPCFQYKVACDLRHSPPRLQDQIARVQLALHKKQRNKGSKNVFHKNKSRCRDGAKCLQGTHVPAWKNQLAEKLQEQGGVPFHAQQSRLTFSGIKDTLDTCSPSLHLATFRCAYYCEPTATILPIPPGELLPLVNCFSALNSCPLYVQVSYPPMPLQISISD